MDNKGTQFEDLAQRISGLVGELPNDGQERQMTVTIGGDNHGDITFGNHITIHAAPGPAPEQAPPSDEQLREMECQAKQQQRAALIRSWCNMPLLLMVMLLIVLLVALLKGVVWDLLNLQDYSFLLPAVFGAVFLPLAIWAGRIKRLEQPIIREAEETLERGRHLRHRQRVACR